MTRRRRQRPHQNQTGGMSGDIAQVGPVARTDGGQPPEGRLLGVDFGARRVGLALSDRTGLIAQGMETIEVENTGEILNAIASVVEAEQVLEVILGMPVNMDGTKGKMADQVEAFADLLKDRVSCAVRTWDERLTSVSARRAMHEMGRGTRGNKGDLDRIAATLLLQNYLDYRRRMADETESGG